MSTPVFQVKPPEDLLINFDNGEWIVVKKYLTAGEANKIFSRMVKKMGPGATQPDGTTKAEIDYDIEQMGGLSQTVTYLLDWSAKGPDGKPLVIRDQPPRVVEELLLALPQDVFKVITDAVSEHVKRMEDERKNGQKGETALPATSPSVGS